MLARVVWLEIDQNHVGQRIDNFLLQYFKHVPKSRIYRALRKGEVRVNKKRVTADYRLQLDDTLRLPPIQQAEHKAKARPSTDFMLKLNQAILHEDDELMVLNKPAGMAVHAGSGIDYGIIEGLKASRGQQSFLELVHRLDKATSGCLLLAKNRTCLLALHELLRSGDLHKYYLAIVKGRWQGGEYTVDQPLAKNQQRGGERVAVTHETGREAVTCFYPLSCGYEDYSLVCAVPITGRTHQIRVHAAHLGFPLLGDDKYGDKAFNQEKRQQGVRGLCLHAYRLHFTLAGTRQALQFQAPVPQDWFKLIAGEDTWRNNLPR